MQTPEDVEPSAGGVMHAGGAALPFTVAGPADCFAGGGQMGALMQRHDWSRTPLGRVATWPQSLRTAVSIMVASRFPMLLLWGRDYTQLYNDAFRPILGATKHPAALGQPARDCWSEIWDVLEPLFGGVMAGGQAVWNEDLQLPLDRNGYLEETFFTFSYSAIRDESGRPGGILVTCVETTERVLGERRLRTLRELAAHAATTQDVAETYGTAAAILAGNPYDLPFVLLYVASGATARLCAATGIARGTAASPEAVPLADPGGPWPLARVMAEAAPQLVTDLSGLVGPIPGGPWPEPVTAALVLPITPSAPGTATGALVAGISPRQTLGPSYRSFLDLVAAQLSAAVGAATAYRAERERAESLAAIDRTKTAFFANISHEFRTPLALMIGPLEEALADDSDPARQHQRLALAHRNALRLLKLVNTLLDFSRIEAGRIEASYEPTGLGELTTELASNFRSAVERAGMTLTIDCPPLPEPVYVDRQMWEKVVLNLLSNAFKFTLAGGITVAQRLTGSAVELTVRDTGVGIPPDELPRVFERFHRVKDARGRSYEGSGIGLALVRELVALHGGEVAVDSEVDRGTMFTVTLPLGHAHLPPARVGAAPGRRPAADQTEAFVQEALHWLPDHQRRDADRRERLSRHVADDLGVGAAGPAPGTGQRVLIVDDNADMRQYLSSLLAGYDVEAVADGASALDAAGAHPPDLVLTDVMMPGLDGIGLLDRLRARPDTREVPVILLSARAGDESRIAGLEAGADDYLTKPFSARELLARVDAHLRLAALRRESQRALRDSEERYRRLAGLTPVGVYTCESPSGVITFYNQQAAQLWGRSPRPGDTDERFCGSFRLRRPDGTVLPHDQTPMALAVREGRSFHNEEVIIERPDGTRISALVNIDPIVDAAGRVVGAINAFHDNTALRSAQEQLRRSEEHLRAVVDATPACITVAAADGTLLHMNAAGLALIEAARPEDVEGAPVFDLISDEHRDSFRAFHERICRGEQGTLEFDVVTRRGVRRHMETHAVPLPGPDGSLQQLAITHDVTERRRSDETYRRLAAIVESSDDAIISTDAGGAITSWNRGAERLYGYTAAEAIGSSISMLLPPGRSDDFDAIMRRLRREERIEHYETERMARDGRRLDVSLTISPIRDARGGVAGISKIARDITERRRTETALRTHAERTRLLWEAGAILLTTHEPDAMLGRLFAKIGAALGLDVYLHYMVAENGSELRLLSCAGIPDETAAVIARLPFGQAVCGTVALRKVPIVARRIQTSDDPMVQLVKGLGIRVYACAPLMAGDRLLGTLSFASRTRDDFEQDEVDFLQTIAQYVAAAYERLRLIAQLREQDQRKDEFLAMLAHELRNPLAPIRTGVQLIQRAGQNRALIDGACAIMERQLRHMVRLVDDLLDVSRVTRNKLELRKEWIELATVVQNAVDTSRPIIEASGHELTVSLPADGVVLDADGVRLAQAFANLLNNAAKYTERGGHISITAERSGSAEAPEVVVRVRDTGIGIPQDHLPRIFDLFAQVERSLERTQGGLGIGLTLARRLIEMHGGTLSASSDGIGKGSEFVARLPVVVLPEPQGGDAARDTNARPPVRRKILVADDNADSAELLATTFRLLGHEVETARDGIDAVDKVAAFRPDAAFMDLGMPRMNGYEAARIIRQHPAGQRVRLIAVTGWGQEDDKVRSREAGFDAHVVKPVDVSALERILDGLAE